MPDVQTMLSWPGLAEMTLATQDNFKVVPSTEAAVEHVNNTAEGLVDDTAIVLMALAMNIRGDGKADHLR